MDALSSYARDTAVATGHSGNSSFARIILTSESIVTHSILSVQLQKYAYLFLYVSHTILITSNQKLQINHGGVIMANYTKTTIGKENRIDLHEKLSLTGAEISLNELPAGANASVFCIRYFRNYLYLHSGKRKFSGTFYSRGCRNRLIKSIYLQKCTVPDMLRTVHFFFLQFYNFSIFRT